MTTPLTTVLSAWNLKVTVPGDGNCLFTAVALSLVECTQNKDVSVINCLARLGIDSSEYNISQLS